MANQYSRFKEWLTHERRFRTAWFEKDPQLTPEPEEALAQLPSELADRLQTAVNELSVHPSEKEKVLTVVKEAIAQWQKRPHLANNSIVVLSHPVSSVSRILVESLSEMQDVDASLDTRLLDWARRPEKAGDLEQQIKQTLDFPKDDGPDRSDRIPKYLAVIPNLCWCFLRSADGLNGIDYLQETLIDDRRQFWIIGSGQVGWEYLKSTLKIHAYCGKVVALPPLTGEQLQHWLEPIVKSFNIRFSNAALHKRLQNPESLLEMDLLKAKPAEVLSEISQEVSATLQSSLRGIQGEVLDASETEQDTSPKYDYFERLADISDGVSMVALQLFLKSLRYRKVTQADIQKGSSGSDPSDVEDANERIIVATIPKLPPLPELSQSDLYLLYSLMLHGDLTIKSLANSLGDAPQVVTNQVQMLRGADVIEQKDGVIKTNPVHYPKLRRELAKNNFIIEVP